MAISESTKQVIYYAILAVFVITAVIGFIFGEALLNQSDHEIAETGSIRADCDLQQSACDVVFSNNRKATFAINPRPITPLTTLELLVNVENMKATQVHVNFEGIDMYMGFYRPQLVAQESGATGQRFKGTATLSVCTLDKMRWQATVIITTDEGNFIAPFQFEVDQS